MLKSLQSVLPSITTAQYISLLQRMKQQVEQIRRHDQEAHPQRHPHVHQELLRQLGVEKLDAEIGIHPRKAGKEGICDEFGLARSHHNGEEPVFAAEGGYGTKHHGHQGFQQAASQFFQMSPKVHNEFVISDW